MVFGILPSKEEVYSYSQKGELIWVELNNRKDKVKGTIHWKKVVEEVGQVPYLEENKFALAGEKAEDGYIITLKKDKETIEAKVSIINSELSLQILGEETSKPLKLVTKEELAAQQEVIQEDLEYALYHMEKKEKDRIAQFVSDFTNVYGYLYSEDDRPYLLFLRIDEALLQGEVTAELLLMEKTEDDNTPYKETSYPVNGITDGQILKLYTDVNGKSTLLEGNFHDSAASFDLTFWLTEEKVQFRAVSEEEFNQKFEAFKAWASKE